MADDDTATEVTTAELPADETRIGKLEAKVDAILDKLSGGSEPEEKPGLSIAEEVRAQIDARDAAEAKRKADDEAAGRLAAVEEKVTGLGEKTPEAPIRRVERIMGWR